MISEPSVILKSWKGFYNRGSVDDIPQDHLSTCVNNYFDGEDIVPRDGLGLLVTLDTGRLVKAFFVYSSDVKAVTQSSLKYPAIFLDSNGFLCDGGTTLNTVIKDFSAYTPIPNGFTAIEAFGRVYISMLFNGNPISDFVYYWDGTNFFKLAGPAPGAGPTLAQANPGIVNAGVHGVAVSFQYADGFLSPPSPITSITSTGINDIEVTAIPTGGANVVARVLLMTLSNQLELFFVPGGTIAGNVTTTGTINVYDTSLISSADYLNDVMTSIPSCTSIKFYSGRMVFIGRYDFPFQLMVSDVDIFDSVSTVGGIVNIPRGSSKNTPSTALVINTILYILKPFGTYQTQDNGGEPNTWGVTIIDSALGSYDSGISLFSSGLSGQDVLDSSFIAHPRGLLLFNGSYSDPPLTYKIDDGWKAFYQTNSNMIRIANDIVNKRLFLVTSSLTVLMMDYTEGLNYKSVKWSFIAFGTIPNGIHLGYFALDIQVFLDQNGAYTPGLIFYGVGVAGFNQIFTLSPSNNQDLSAYLINQQFQTALVSIVLGSVSTFNGLRFRISGTNNFGIALADESLSNIATPVGFNLSNRSNNKDLYRGINVTNEKIAIALNSTQSDGGINGNFSLTRIDIFGSEKYKVRPYPKVIISNIVSSGGLIKITAIAHGYSTGNKVNVLGVTGTTEANGNQQTITVIDPNNYTINGSTFVHLYTGGGISWVL